MSSAADFAEQQVARVRDDPSGRLDLLRELYEGDAGGAQVHLPFRRAASAFMRWQLRRGLLRPETGPSPGSPWWRAVNERLLRDGWEARVLLGGGGGPASSISVELAVRFIAEPTARNWYRAHNASVVSAYLDNLDLARTETRTERFFMNLVLMRVLYAHALVSAPRLALGRLAPVAPLLGDPRLGMTGVFLSLSRILPDRYPLGDDVETYVAVEHSFGRMLDVGVISPRLKDLYEWSAHELGQPRLAELLLDRTPCYAWPPHDSSPWRPPLSLSARIALRAAPPLRDDPPSMS
ncbi:hypothetical protein [Nocardia sp. bgisy118]|uniref:hypothetical protein n=1 Tax=Nocardia sp. bgisy118 TaxID=3413786 RepID=UPI003F49BDC1